MSAQPAPTQATRIEWTGNIQVHHPIKEQPCKPQQVVSCDEGLRVGECDDWPAR